MAQVTFDNSNALTFAGVDAEMIKATDAAAELLYNGQGAGNDFIGWVNLPSSITAEELTDIKATAATLRSKADVVVFDEKYIENIKEIQKRGNTKLQKYICM